MIKLSELRNEKGLTQREIAKIFNVSQGTYNNWENGKTQPSIEQLVTIADFFGVSIDYLVGRGRRRHYRKREGRPNQSFGQVARRSLRVFENHIRQKIIDRLTAVCFYKNIVL